MEKREENAILELMLKNVAFVENLRENMILYDMQKI